MAAASQRAAAVRVLREALARTGAARLQRIESVLARRAAWPVLVLENASDPHNAAACLRTAEGMGLQHVHLIERHGMARVSAGVTTDADRWLSVSRFSTAQACVERLRGEGCTVIASDLVADAAPLDDVLARFDTSTSRLAVVLGNENSGISPFMRAAADHRFILPMHGFVQSFNLSATAAMILTTLCLRGHIRHGSLAADAALSEDVLLNWLFKSVRYPKQLLARHGLVLDDY